MKSIKLLVLAAILACASRAAAVTITITGSVHSGTDGNPASKPPGAGNVFGAGSNLAGEPFALTLHVADSNGTTTMAKCSNGSVYTSTIEGTSASAAATATLQIGTGSFTYGSYPLRTIGWSTGRTAHEACSSYNSISFAWSENYDGGYSGGSGFGAAVLYSLTNFPSANLYFSLPRVSVTGSAFQFNIEVVHSGTLIKYAYGYLTPQSVSVDGIPSLDYKTTSAVLGSLFGQVADAYDGAAIVAEGPENLAANVSTSVAVKVLASAVSGNDEIFGQKIELSAGVLQFMQEAAKRLTKRNLASLVLEADSLVFSTASLISNLVADDPPDPNFKVVEPPQALSFPTTGNPQVDKALADYLGYISLLTATLHAGERWQGAVLAGDEASVVLQENAYQSYSQQAAGAEAALTADDAILAGSSPAIDITTFPGGATAIANALTAQCGQSLPSDLNADLLGIGLSQTTINSMVCSTVNNITASDITTDFKTLLASPLPHLP